MTLAGHSALTGEPRGGARNGLSLLKPERALQFHRAARVQLEGTASWTGGVEPSPEARGESGDGSERLGTGARR